MFYNMFSIDFKKDPLILFMAEVSFLFHRHSIYNCNLIKTKKKGTLVMINIPISPFSGSDEIRTRGTVTRTAV